jgi:hypothetical protein
MGREAEKTMVARFLAWKVYAFDLNTVVKTVAREYK